MDSYANSEPKGSFQGEEACITYDVDTIGIVGKFNDEMAAYRGRRKWVEILGNHFLLESERDYQLAITVTEHGYSLTCELNSACGRYAFWRLINHQAPEAERKLINAGYPLSESEKLGNDYNSDLRNIPWISSGGVSEPMLRNHRITDRLRKLLSKFGLYSSSPLPKR